MSQAAYPLATSFQELDRFKNVYLALRVTPQVVRFTCQESTTVFNKFNATTDAIMWSS